jgi:hypothetical protein
VIFVEDISLICELKLEFKAKSIQISITHSNVLIVTEMNEILLIKIKGKIIQSTLKIYIENP